MIYKKLFVTPHLLAVLEKGTTINQADIVRYKHQLSFRNVSIQLAPMGGMLST